TSVPKPLSASATATPAASDKAPRCRGSFISYPSEAVKDSRRVDNQLRLRRPRPFVCSVATSQMAVVDTPDDSDDSGNLADPADPAGSSGSRRSNSLLVESIRST